MGLVELRQATLRGDGELVVIACALVNRFRKGVGDAALELRRVVPQGNLEAVIDGLPGIVDLIDGTEVRIQITIDSSIVRHGVDRTVWHLYRVGGNTALGGLERGWEQVDVQPKVPVCLASHTVGVP